MTALLDRAHIDRKEKCWIRLNSYLVVVQGRITDSIGLLVLTMHWREERFSVVAIVGILLKNNYQEKA